MTCLMYMLLPLIHSQSETVQKFSKQGINITLYSGELKQGTLSCSGKFSYIKQWQNNENKNNKNAGATGDLIQLIIMLPRLRFWVFFWLRRGSHWSRSHHASWRARHCMRPAHHSSRRTRPVADRRLRRREAASRGCSDNAAAWP